MTVDSGKTSPAVVEYDAYDATVEGVIDALEPLGFESNVIDATGGEPCCSLDLGDGRCLDVTVKLTMTCECCTLDGTHNHNQCEHVCCPTGTAAASLMGEGSMILPRCGQCASGRHSHCEHPDFPAPARSCCCGLLEFEDPVVDLEDRQAMALVAKFWAESDEGGEVTDASTTARRRGTTLSPAELFVLDQWGRQLQDAFDQTPYLVGSAERGGDWRDVDVRMLLPWAEDVMSAFGVYTLNVAISLWGRHVTGLPIDFQMQGEQAFHGYDGETRNPLGGRSKTKYRGVTKFALGLDDDGGEVTDGE